MNVDSWLEKMITRATQKRTVVANCIARRSVRGEKVSDWAKREWTHREGLVKRILMWRYEE